MSPQRDRTTTSGGSINKSKGQSTLISNYFKRVESPSEKGKSTRKPRNNDHPPGSSSPLVPPSSSDIEDAEDEHVSKKRRLETPPRTTQGGAGSHDGERNALTALMSPKVKEFRPPPESPRTARYKYIPSSQNKEDDQITPEDQAKRKSLHEKFVAKLGRPESLASVERPSTAGTQMEEEEDEGGEDTEVTAAGKELREKYAAAQPKEPQKPNELSELAKKAKLTPLEQQYVKIKELYEDTILMIEVGYKFRFFGEDAKIASKELGIAHFMNHNFYTASVPVPRLHIHAGHKVGVVRQLETAALKAVGDNKSAPFERKLTELYTKGTYIDNFNLDDEQSAVAPSSGYIMCVVENLLGGSGIDEKVEIGMVAIQPMTGDVVWDRFEDGYMRAELETRVLHLLPSEILLAGEISVPSRKVLSRLSTHTASSSEAIRIEETEIDCDIGQIKYNIGHWYFHDKNCPADTVDQIMRFPKPTVFAFYALFNYVREFGLANIFKTPCFQHFSSRAHMLLNGSTLSSLEIYRNQTDFSEKGSLFWVLDHTRTKFGRRMLRKWIGRPLLTREYLLLLLDLTSREIEARLGAVEEIKESTNYKLEDVASLLTRLPDLEKGLVRIHYGRCTRPELLSILNALSRVANKFPQVEEPEDIGFKSEIINNAIYSLPAMADDVGDFLAAFNHDEAAKDNKFDMFKEDKKYDRITEHKMAIVAVEADLDEHLLEIRKMLKHSKLNYVTVAGIEYLIEVKNADVARVPKNWVKVSGTKVVSRFHSPEIIKFIQEREQQKESLAMECDKAFKAFLKEISEQYEFFREVVHHLATLDCLLSLAAVAVLPGYTKPEFVDSGGIEVVAARHPMVEQVLVDSFVPNDINLKHDEMRALILTGPNMGGKSCYIRSVALITIMAQIGSYVPCQSAKLTLVDGVYTRMGAFDNMLRGESTFMYEMNETSEIIRSSTLRSLVVLDEIGRGTATFDGYAIANAVLRHFVEDTRCLTLFVTHYPQIQEIASEHPTQVDGTQEVTFLYKLTPGIAHRSYGLNVARLANLPSEVIAVAGEKSRLMEEETQHREWQRWAEKAREAVRSEHLDLDLIKELAKRLD